MIDLPGMDEIWAALPEARVAGGAVRDMLAGCPVADVDFASPLPPEQVISRAKAAGLKVVATGLQHGTVTLVAGGRGFEVTSLRRDKETDGRHAIVEFTDDWREDAARRDFTINAMFCNQNGKIYDYFGGQEDLKAGIVRFVGEAEQRISEDYLRILRFFRFFARFGRGAPDAVALAAITKLREGVKRLSAERVWSELKRILLAPAPLASMTLMRETGVLELLLPGATLSGLDVLLARGGPDDAVLRLAALTKEDLAERLRLSKAEASRLQGLRMEMGLRPGDDDDALRRALADEPADVLVGRSWLAGGGSAWDGLRARLAAMARPVFPLQGRDIASLGVEAGPRVGAVLDAVRSWWLQGGCLAGREACLAQARLQLG